MARVKQSARKSCVTGGTGGRPQPSLANSSSSSGSGGTAVAAAAAAAAQAGGTAPRRSGRVIPPADAPSKHTYVAGDLVRITARDYDNERRHYITQVFRLKNHPYAEIMFGDAPMSVAFGKLELVKSAADTGQGRTLAAAAAAAEEEEEDEEEDEDEEEEEEKKAPPAKKSKGKKYICSVCGEGGHNKTTCTAGGGGKRKAAAAEEEEQEEEEEEEQEEEKEPRIMTCWNCGEKGHNRRGCLKAGKSRAKAKGKGKGKGKGKAAVATPSAAELAEAAALEARIKVLEETQKIILAGMTKNAANIDKILGLLTKRNDGAGDPGAS